MKIWTLTIIKKAGYHQGAQWKLLGLLEIKKKQNIAVSSAKIST